MGMGVTGHCVLLSHKSLWEASHTHSYSKALTFCRRCELATPRDGDSQRRRGRGNEDDERFFLSIGTESEENEATIAGITALSNKRNGDHDA